MWHAQDLTNGRVGLLRVFQAKSIRQLIPQLRAIYKLNDLEYQLEENTPLTYIITSKSNTDLYIVANKYN